MVSPILYRRAIPADAVISDWSAPDGWPLRRFDWPVAAGVPPRGSILFQGGRGDFFEKYLESFAHWHAKGWHITSFDWRGQGGSGRMTDAAHVGHIDRFATYIDDLRAFYTQWRGERAGPYVVMGHSMGGHLVLRALVGRVIAPDAVVLVAPMLGLNGPFGPWLGERLARMLGGVGNAARPAWKTNERPYTRDPRSKLLTHDAECYADEVWWQKTDPRLITGPPSWHWVIEAYRSTRELRADRALKALPFPILMLVADTDKLVDPKAALSVAAKLRHARVVRFGSESAHEILREVDTVRNRAIGEIDLFLAARAQPR